VYLVGLTGGIAAGKSTVAKHWVSRGAIEIDADLVAREVVLPGSEGAKQIEEVFGASYFDAEGNLDRKALGTLVFESKAELEKLEGIVHPLVRARAGELLSSAPNDAIVIYTVPLLVEANVDLNFDYVVTVEAPETERISRLVEHRGFSVEDARARISNQASPIERAARADFILNSNQDIFLLLRDADALWQKFVIANEAKK
jgi:dephospho-CoA kinase